MASKVLLPSWAEKLSALRSLPHVQWAGLIPPLLLPKGAHVAKVRETKFVLIKHGGIDGVALGVTSNRSKCLVVIEMPADITLAIISNSPATLEFVVPAVSRVLGPTFVCESS